MSDIRQLRNPSRPAPALIPRYGPRLYAFGEYPVPVLSTPRCGQYPAQRGAAMRRDGRANAASGPLLGWALGMCIARGWRSGRRMAWRHLIGLGRAVANSYNICLGLRSG